MSVDYSDLPEDEYIDVAEEVIQLLRALQGVPSDSTMLVIANIINTQATSTIVDKIRETLAAVDGFRTHAYALVGERGILKQLARVDLPGAYLTGSEQDARNWLLKQAKRLSRDHAAEN
jgi:hypothetical protein